MNLIVSSWRHSRTEQNIAPGGFKMKNFDSYIHSQIFSKDQANKQTNKNKEKAKKSETVPNNLIVSDPAAVRLKQLKVCYRLMHVSHYANVMEQDFQQERGVSIKQKRWSKTLQS